MKMVTVNRVTTVLDDRYGFSNWYSWFSVATGKRQGNVVEIFVYVHQNVGGDANFARVKKLFEDCPNVTVKWAGEIKAL